MLYNSCPISTLRSIREIRTAKRAEENRVAELCLPCRFCLLFRYAVVRNVTTQQLKIEAGPQSYFMDAYEEMPRHNALDFVTLGTLFPIY
jgi:hypothetical protein